MSLDLIEELSRLYRAADASVACVSRLLYEAGGKQDKDTARVARGVVLLLLGQTGNSGSLAEVRHRLLRVGHLLDHAETELSWNGQTLAAHKIVDRIGEILICKLPLVKRGIPVDNIPAEVERQWKPVRKQLLAAKSTLDSCMDTSDIALRDALAREYKLVLSRISGTNTSELAATKDTGKPHDPLDDELRGQMLLIYRFIRDQGRQAKDGGRVVTFADLDRQDFWRSSDRDDGTIIRALRKLQHALSRNATCGKSLRIEERSGRATLT